MTEDMPSIDSDAVFDSSSVVDTTEPKQHYVYILRDPRPVKQEEPFYVGKGQKNRAYVHLCPSRNAGKRLGRIIAKILGLGLEPIIELAAYFDTHEEALEYEKVLIAHYGRYDLGKGPLCNLTDGGEGTVGWVPTENQRTAISKRTRKRHKEYPEWRWTITDGWHTWWSNPEVQAAHSARMRVEMQKPERLAQIVAQAKSNPSNPIWLAGQRKIMAAINAMFGEANAARLREQNVKAEFIAESKAKRRVWIDLPSTRAAMREQYHQNGGKEALLAGVQDHWNKPGTRAAAAQRQAERNRDPEHAGKVREALRDDLTGQIFNRLTVLSYVGFEPGKRPRYICRCECGNEKIVTGKHLKNGGCQSCGCLQREAGSNARKVDISGQRFGSLVAVSYQGDSKWLCKCDCGGETLAKTGGLNSGHITSCGCRRMVGYANLRPKQKTNA